MVLNSRLLEYLVYNYADKCQSRHFFTILLRETQKLHRMYLLLKRGIQALHQQQAKDYFILLLITDGILTDMDQTIHMIIG